MCVNNLTILVKINPHSKSVSKQVPVFSLGQAPPTMGGDLCPISIDAI